MPTPTPTPTEPPEPRPPSASPTATIASAAASTAASTTASTKPATGRYRPSGLRRRAAALDPTLRGLIWSACAGLVFCVLNALMRGLTLKVDPFQAQFLRYAFAVLVLLPLIFRGGLASWWPQQVGGQFTRGALHTLGLTLWFTALPRIPLADMTAIGFTAPIFIMLGAWFFFKEPMRWERWLAAGLGFTGVLIVVAPRLSGDGGYYNLVMLASSPLFAASFLVTKALTRYENTGVILLWQAMTVSLFSLPLALLDWQPLAPLQWLGFLACGLLGSLAHYCLTQSYRVADISSTQSVKFLDLIWAAIFGWLAFGDTPSQSTLSGGLVICAATIWIARRESRNPTA